MCEEDFYISKNNLQNIKYYILYTLFNLFSPLILKI